MWSWEEEGAWALMNQRQHLSAQNMNPRLLTPFFKFILFFWFTRLWWGSLFWIVEWQMCPWASSTTYKPSKDIFPEQSCIGQPNSNLCFLSLGLQHSLGSPLGCGYFPAPLFPCSASVYPTADLGDLSRSNALLPGPPHGIKIVI